MKKLNERTEKALTGLEIAMREVNANERREGEFTVDDFLLELSAKGHLISHDTAGKRLVSMAKQGLLKYRMISYKGSKTRVYSAALTDKVQD
jgi:hypothetical protein